MATVTLTGSSLGNVSSTVTSLTVSERFGRNDDRLEFELSTVSTVPYLESFSLALSQGTSRAAFLSFEVDGFQIDRTNKTTKISCIRGEDDYRIALQLLEGISSNAFPSNERFDRWDNILGTPFNSWLVDRIILQGKTPSFRDIIQILNEYGLTLAFNLNLSGYANISTDFGNVQVVPVDARIGIIRKSLPEGALLVDKVVSMPDSGDGWKTRRMTTALAPGNVGDRLTTGFGTGTRDIVDLGEEFSYRESIIRQAGERAFRAVNAVQATVDFPLDITWRLRDGVITIPGDYLSTNWIVSGIVHNLQSQTTTLELIQDPGITLADLLGTAGAVGSLAIPEKPTLEVYSPATRFTSGGDAALFVGRFSDVGAPFTNIYIQRNGLGRGIDIPGREDWHDVNGGIYPLIYGLWDAGSSVDLRIRAENELGLGEWSEPYSYRVPTGGDPYITSLLYAPMRDMQAIIALPALQEIRLTAELLDVSVVEHHSQQDDNMFPNILYWLENDNSLVPESYRNRVEEWPIVKDAILELGTDLGGNLSIGPHISVFRDAVRNLILGGEGIYIFAFARGNGYEVSDDFDIEIAAAKTDADGNNPVWDTSAILNTRLQASTLEETVRINKYARLLLARSRFGGAAFLLEGTPVSQFILQYRIRPRSIGVGIGGWVYTPRLRLSEFIGRSWLDSDYNIISNPFTPVPESVLPKYPQWLDSNGDYE